MSHKVSEEVVEFMRKAKEGDVEIDGIKIVKRSLCKIDYKCSSDIMRRIMHSYGVVTIQDLAEKLDKTSSRIYKIIRLQEFVPEKYVLQCFIDTGANPFWLITGDDKKYRKFLTEYLEN